MIISIEWVHIHTEKDGNSHYEMYTVDEYININENIDYATYQAETAIYHTMHSELFRNFQPSPLHVFQ